MHTPLANAALARTPLTFIAPDGRETRGAVTLGVPRPVSDGGWECSVALEGWAGQLGPIAGEDALQALTLALTLVGRQLRAFLAAGGRLHDDDGAPWPVDAYFPRI